ncbi:NAD(+)/NADH kinase [Moorellaceae bacterium AZ2]
MQRIALIANHSKPQVYGVALNLMDWLEKRGVEPLVLSSTAEKLGCPGRGIPAEELVKADCVLSLGGDGTLLQAARLVAEMGIPILGVNLGHLGFLTEIELSELFPSLERLLGGDFSIEERMMLSTCLWRDGRKAFFTALNDVVITKGAFSRMLRLEVYVGEAYLDTYPADGLIVSSPTGSTAYSLSAGGPLVSPELQVMIITPICPHTLYARPLVVRGDREIRVKVYAAGAEVMLTVDGQQGVHLNHGDEVITSKAGVPARLIRLQGRSFYSLVREKLREGGNRHSLEEPGEEG